jgi:hypothetical protein
MADVHRDHSRRAAGLTALGLRPGRRSRFSPRTKTLRRLLTAIGEQAV